MILKTNTLILLIQSCHIENTYMNEWGIKRQNLANTMNEHYNDDKT